MKKKFNKKRVTIVALCLCLLLSGVAGTWAYLSSITDPLQNTFTPAKVTCSVEEKFENGVKSEVKVRNTGDINAYIRATIVATYVLDGKIYAIAPVEGTDYIVEWANGKWKKGTDGFWYYSDAVAPNEATNNLIKTAKVVSVPEGCSFNLQIIATAIQAEPDLAVQSAWGITPVNGQITPN